MSDIIETLKAERVKLTSEIERLKGIIKSIDVLIESYNGQILPSSKKNDTNFIVTYNQNLKGYSLKDTVKNVALNLKNVERANKIAEILLELYPEKKNNELNFKTQVSGLLSAWGRSGEILKYQFSPSKKDTVWGGPDLFDENGKPKQQVL